MADALPGLTQQALTWQSYGSDASNLVAPILCDFTTYSQYTFNPQGLFRNAGNVYATGVVVDNLLNVGPVTVMIGPITETIPPYTKQTLTLGGSSAPVTVAGTQAKILVSFFYGNYMGSTSGTNFYAAQLAASLAVETGFVSMFAGSLPSIPVGYLLCDGSAVSRATYAGLFSKIGTLYGAGDGSTTFNLPDLTSRVPIGAGTGAGLSTRALASQGGQEAVVISATQLPVHTHAVTDTGHSHANTDNGHVHGINDPGHTHVFGLSNGAFPNLIRIDRATLPPSQWTFDSGDNARIGLSGYPRYVDPNLQTTFTFNIAAATSGVSTINGKANITITNATTGITIASAGGIAGTTQPTPTVPPYTALNFVIKT